MTNAFNLRSSFRMGIISSRRMLLEPGSTGTVLSRSPEPSAHRLLRSTAKAERRQKARRIRAAACGQFAGELLIVRFFQTSGEPVIRQKTRIRPRCARSPNCSLMAMRISPASANSAIRSSQSSQIDTPHTGIRLANTVSHPLARCGRIACSSEIALEGLYLPVSDQKIFHVPE